ncbi:MAG: COR domain-containing protein [Bryobacteraceae bacterium]|nr:COR domain-containing protein [Bryobacteraceae bacterium]
MPQEVGELDWLEGLSFSEWRREGLDDSGPWDRTTNDGGPNTLSDGIGPVAGLRRLRCLWLTGTEVSDLGPLAGLSALASLYLFGTKVSELGPLAGLSALTLLDLSGTQVTDLRPLAGLPALRMLNLAYAPVTDLSPLLPLIRRGVPVLRGMWGAEDAIYVAGCPLTVPPVEVVQQGNEAILNFFREREEQGEDRLYEAKLLLIGEGGAGKTSLLRRLYQRDLPLPSESETTKGIAIYRHEFPLKNGRTFRLNVWDFAGQEIYHATHQFFLTRRSLYVLVDDTRTDHQSATDEGFRYWLDLVDVFGGHSPVLIFQNEKGGRSKALDWGGIKGRYDNVEERYTGDLLERAAADGLREGIEYHAAKLRHVGDALPAKWVQIRADIEERARAVPWIPQQEYFEIYERHLPRDRERALHLSRYLHDLGVFLHFQDDALLRHTVILQNEWATEAVFRILDDEEVKRRSGLFDEGDCLRVWRDSRYAGMHAELRALMANFELCYELQDRRPRGWLAAQLLPPSKPERLAGWGRPDDLVLRYRYQFLPKGTISRLTVRLNRYIADPALAWRSGVLFSSDGTDVLVELLADGREIELRARGADRKELLAVAAADLDALNHSIPGLRDKVDKRIPCPCTVCAGSAAPEFFSHQKLRQRRKDGRWKVECGRSYLEVSVRELLEGVGDRDEGERYISGQRPEARTVRLFLASSEELREDRDAFDLYLRQLNDGLRREGLYLVVVRWEWFLDAMSETRLQDEYNRAVAACDVFVALFRTKVGRYTEEEFDVAHRQFLACGVPRIYTYFKNAEVRMAELPRKDLETVWAFQEKLRGLGHYWSVYNDIEHLKRQFRDQLDLLRGQIRH